METFITKENINRAYNYCIKMYNRLAMQHIRPTEDDAAMLLEWVDNDGMLRNIARAAQDYVLLHGEELQKKRDYRRDKLQALAGKRRNVIINMAEAIR